MSSIHLFDHPKFGSLTIYVDENGKEFYKANDVCIALRLANTSEQVKRIKDKWVFKFADGLSNSGKALYLSEPGLYAMIFRSKTLQASEFQDWVFEEVLPKLRTSGGYIMPTATSEQLEALQSEITNLQNENQKLLVQNTNLESSRFDKVIRLFIEAVTNGFGNGYIFKTWDNTEYEFCSFWSKRWKAYSTYDPDNGCSGQGIMKASRYYAGSDFNPDEYPLEVVLQAVSKELTTHPRYQKYKDSIKHYYPDLYQKCIESAAKLK